jgi:hypothetical protein
LGVQGAARSHTPPICYLRSANPGFPSSLSNISSLQPSLSPVGPRCCGPSDAAAPINRERASPYHHLLSSICYLRFFHQSGGKMLKLSMTALLFVTTGTLYQLVYKMPAMLVVVNVTTFVKLLPKRTTARVAISDTT